MNYDIQELINNGQAYMAAEKYESAVKEFSKALELDKMNAEILSQLGNAFVCLEQYDEAMNSFKSALMVDSENGKILYSIGGVYLLKNDFAEAVRYYNRAEAAGYRSVEMYLILSGVFAESEDYPQAIRAITRAIELKPLRGDLYARKAELQAEYGMYDDALVTLKDFKELIPDSYDVYEQMVRIYCLQKKYTLAEGVAEEALSRFPNDPAIMLLKLQVLVESGKYADAVCYSDSLLPAAQENDSILGQIVLYKATSLALQGKTPDVIRTLENYRCLNTDEKALYLLMNTCMLQKQFSKVIDKAEILERISSDPGIKAAAMYYRVNAIQNMKGIEFAAQEYKKILPILRRISVEAPQNYEIYIYRLLSHAEIGEFEKAIALADYLENAYPELPDGHMYKYHIYKRMGDHDKAKMEREAVMKIAPDLQLEPVM